MLLHYCEFMIADFPFKRVEEKEILERNSMVYDRPEGTIGFRFFDREEMIVDGEKLKGMRENYSPWTYFGKEYTLEEVKEAFPNERTLINNMKRNGWNRMVETHEAIWIPLMKGDKVVS